jgi:AcrR family transcriptional regulator
MPTQEERSAATRAAIIAAAIEHFADVGYDAASIDDIARMATVSKGALYHHFPNKASVMAAVYEDLERGVVERFVRSTRGELSPLEAIRKGGHEFIRACLDDRFRRLALVEAPAALGWQRWREIDAQFGLGLLRAATKAAADAGELRDVDPETTAHGLLAVLMEGALLIGQATTRRAAHRSVVTLFDALVDGLGRPQPRRRSAGSPSRNAREASTRSPRPRPETTAVNRRRSG